MKNLLPVYIYFNFLDIEITKTKKPKKSSNSNTSPVSSTSSGDSGIKLDASKSSNVAESKKSKSEEDWKREIHEQFQKLEPDAKWKYFMVAKKVVNQFQAICVLKNSKPLSGYGMNFIGVFINNR